MKVKCEECEGTGHYLRISPNGSENVNECYTCGGTGYVYECPVCGYSPIPEGEECENCHGNLDAMK